MRTCPRQIPSTVVCRRRQYEEDAGALSFDRVADTQLDQLRLRVAAALVTSQGAPRAPARSMKGNSAR